MSSHTDSLPPSPDYGSSDFHELLKRKYPHLAPDFSHFFGQGRVSTSSTNWEQSIPIGTTILAMKYKDGAFIAGDRQAVEGYQVGERRIEKVYKTDEYSAIAIAGVAGPCIEMAKLFQIQLEYHEKQEGVSLSLEGKANFLSGLIRSNLSAAMVGLVVIPIFAGYDLNRKIGRIFKYDVTGGRYEEVDYYATGSGGKDARGTLKKRYRPNIERDEGLKAILEAIWDAADEDLATGGPDFIRDIYPTVKTINNSGIENVSDSEIKQVYELLINALKESKK
ncbi:proteasome subunit beta [bacterium]|nr:proteasome subunit beta [bacterium]